MTGADLIPEARVDDLVAGALPEREAEARLQGLVRALRAEAPPAPQRLRDRVVAARADARRPARPHVAWRRAAVVAAPVVLALAAGALLLRPDVTIPSSQRGAATVSQEAATDSGGGEAATGRFAPAGEPAEKQAFGQPRSEASGSTTLLSPLPDTARARDVDFALELRLQHADDVSAASTDAMRIARELGGFVASSHVETGQGEGTAALTLRVPVGRLEDAVVRLSALGTVTAQDVTIQDLQGGVDRRAARIERLERAIRADELRLASGTLDAEERLEVQLRLERERALLRDVRRQRAALLRRASTAEIDLRLHTRATAAAPEAGGVSGAARDAFDLLGRAGTGLVYVAILAAPFLIALALVWVALRRRARRSEERLLTEPRPGLARD